jgi:hypothetical protein
MDPMLINIDDTQRAPGRRFNTREFWRLVAMAKPYRRYLVVGLLCTVFFAGLQTAGIGGAFPVFQILLEEEGLHGWVDRTVAGHRVDITLAPVTSEDRIHIVKAPADGTGYSAGLRVGDELRDESGRPIRVLLAELAEGKTIPARVNDRTLSLQPHD